MNNSFKNKLEETILTNNDSFVLDSTLVELTENFLLPNINQMIPLYRYSKVDYDNIRNLETERLYLIEAGNMNDVFEGLSSKADQNILDNINSLSDIVFLKSFSEENNNPLMWAHYTDNYSGMCVEYDFTLLSKKLLFHLFPVIYSAKRTNFKNLTESTLSELSELKEAYKKDNPPEKILFTKDVLSSFLCKSNSWSYEKEWRIIATYPQLCFQAEKVGDDCPQLYICDNDKENKLEENRIINVKNCIKAVYLGPRIKSNIKRHIFEICTREHNNINVFTSTLSEDQYKLVFQPYNGD